MDFYAMMIHTSLLSRGADGPDSEGSRPSRMGEINEVTCAIATERAARDTPHAPDARAWDTNAVSCQAMAFPIDEAVLGVVTTFPFTRPSRRSSRP